MYTTFSFQSIINGLIFHSHLVLSTPVTDRPPNRYTSAFNENNEYNPTSSQDLRTVRDIIYSSLVTILACTWIAMHPNVPGPDDSWFARRFDRVVIFLVALLAPEFIVGWAASQYRAAHYLMKEIQYSALDPAHLSYSNPH
jgi:hypothetical protein